MCPTDKTPHTTNNAYTNQFIATLEVIANAWKLPKSFSVWG
jgi:hypothetical protein